MLIEKMNDVEELVEYLKKIVTKVKQNRYEKEQKELLSTIINLVLSRKIGQDVAKKLIEELKERGGEEMLAVLEMIDEENKRIFEDGKRQGKARKKKQKKLLRKY